MIARLIRWSVANRLLVLLATVAGPAGSDVLVELNPATGAVVRDLGPLGFGPVFGLALTRQDVLYGALPAITGTIITALIAIVIAWPIGVPPSATMSLHFTALAG